MGGGGGSIIVYPEGDRCIVAPGAAGVLRATCGYCRIFATPPAPPWSIWPERDPTNLTSRLTLDTEKRNDEAHNSEYGRTQPARFFGAAGTVRTSDDLV